MVIIWIIASLIALFIICNCVKNSVQIVAKTRFKNVPNQTQTPVTDKNKCIQALFDDDVEKFFKYKGITFWYYKDSKDYFEKQSFSVVDVKNKIAQCHNDLKQKYPGITDFFVSMTKQNNYLTWKFDPIDFNSYIPPKSTKDICIDEFNKLIENNKIKEKHDI